MVEPLELIEPTEIDPEEDDGRHPDDMAAEGYWAANEDSRRVLEGLRDAIARGEDDLEQSEHYQSVCRNGLYYWNRTTDGEAYGETAVRVRGPYGETLEFSAAFFRYFLRQQLTAVTAEDPPFDVAALTPDARSRRAARFGRQILEAYRQNRGMRAELVSAAENALAHTVGGIAVLWRQDLSVASDAMEEDPELYAGDVELMALEPGIDWGWDYNYQAAWEEQYWCYIDRWENKWELIARYGELRDDILDQGDGTDHWDKGGYSYTHRRKDTDAILTRTFFHRKCLALPEGRMIVAVGDVAIYDGANPYGRLPVYTIRPSRYGRDNVWGWSPGFDIQGQQEMVCELLSRLATELDAPNRTLIWSQNASGLPDPEDMASPGPTRVTGMTKPEAIDLGTIDQAAFQFYQAVVNDMQMLTGVSSGLQGTAGSNLRSHAQQVHQSEQSRRFHSEFQSSWEDLNRRVGQAVLRTIEIFAQGDRMVEIVGTSGAPEMLRFQPGDLEDAMSVTIRRGPNVLQTTEGRFQLLESMKGLGVTINDEQLASILEGAPIQTLTKNQTAQVELAQDENELLMQQPDQYVHTADLTDDHLLHIREHSALLSTVEARYDERLYQTVTAAVAQHLQLLKHPVGAQINWLLQYDHEGKGMQLMQLEQAEEQAKNAQVEAQAAQAQSAEAQAEQQRQQEQERQANG